MTLAMPRTVARVVVYALGIEACQLQARQADGWTTIAELTPADAERCEARFQPVRTSAIRLRVLKTRADRFQVYEVEAYEQ